MNKSELINSANLLPRITPEALTEYRSKSGRMAEQLNEHFISDNEIENLIGNNNIDLMKNNHENHAHFMASVFENFSAETLVNTILWVFKVYRSREFKPVYWHRQLNCWIDLIKENIDTNEQDGILDYYKWMIEHINDFTQLTDAKEIDCLPENR